MISRSLVSSGHRAKRGYQMSSLNKVLLSPEAVPVLCLVLPREEWRQEVSSESVQLVRRH